MKIFVRVRPGAAVPRVEKVDDQHFIVAVREPPIEGRANVAAAAALAEHLDVPQNRITLVSGRTGRRKVFEVRM